MHKFLQKPYISIKPALRHQIKRQRHKNSPSHMESGQFWPDLQPPDNVRGMQILNRDQFRKTIKVPKLDVEELNINSILPHLKKFLLKLDRMKPVQLKSDGIGKKVILHPMTVTSWEDIPEEIKNQGIRSTALAWEEIELSYENWKADEILKAVLPADQENVASFSRIGHIVHVNLRDHVLPYKTLIGEVLKDKTANCRTVVNKLQTIENTYRNFQMELLCGEPDYKVEVKENGVAFEFDFSTVYWNPRLATEHERIVKLLQPADVLYDVFAGVGPFSVPAGRKKCTVLANDLNPQSFYWLNQNCKRNKVTKVVSTFELDGRDFILKQIKDDLVRRWNEAIDNSYKIHITMNLPAMAIEFLDAFVGLLAENQDEEFRQKIYPLVHVYCFAKGIQDLPKIALEMAEHHIGSKLIENLEGVHFVRNVAPNKDMYRVSFYLTDAILFAKPQTDGLKRACSSQETSDLPKKICL